MLVPKYCLNDINDSVFAKEMIRQMLHKDPSQRPTLHEIQNAPFLWIHVDKIYLIYFRASLLRVSSRLPSALTMTSTAHQVNIALTTIILG